MTPEQEQALKGMREVARDAEALFKVHMTRSTRWEYFGNIKDRLHQAQIEVSDELDKVFAQAVRNVE
jgi:hypothetical protein